MMQSTSKIVIASAGSGKTTWVVESALGCEGRSAVVSYTINNTQKIRERFVDVADAVPSRVTVVTWFGFLLRDLVRPYQNYFREGRIAMLHFVEGRSAKYAKRGTSKYFFDVEGRIYSDKISAFALLCNELSGGLVFERLKALYGTIYIDEVQDLAGYDLELVEAGMRAGVCFRLVGDNRQATYSTNSSAKNKAFRGPRVVEKFRAWESTGLCELESHAWSYRCNQQVCDVADQLFPDCEPCTSRSTEKSDHAGVFLVEKRFVGRYIDAYQPQVLVFNRRTPTGGHKGLNFGDSKGLEFPHVLILPTGPIRKWLKSGDPSAIKAPSSLAKLYVAITRAKHSVGFVYDGESAVNGVGRFSPSKLA